MNFEQIHKALNGVGRITQYRNTMSLESPTSVDFSNEEQNEIVCVYDGLIGEGRPHGFGRAIFCDNLKVFTGPFDNGR